MVSLKEIRLTGFKSFADRTVIKMTEGVTCIVGPNGCGKSNVSDAIRWVMGEQSAKNMRGSQMTDVIFDGAESRRRVSYCEVTLVFDNTRHIFDCDAEEIEMTRRLYRDGDSDYLLNRQSTRLKTLTNLLHGAGITREGYTIIGQGRIAQIMDSKPEARRPVFEEATGIVVFKDRKADTERRLAAAKDNLRVFQSRFEEVEKQRGPLAKAAEVAKKYKEIYANLRFHEVNAYIYRTDGSADERGRLQGERDGISAKIAEITERAKAIASEELDLRNLQDIADRKLKELNDRRLELSVGDERMKSRSNILVEKANQMSEKLNAARDELNVSVSQTEKIDSDIRREEHLMSQNSSRLVSMNEYVGQLKEELADLNGRIAQHESESGESRRKMVDAIKELSSIRENMGSLSAQADYLRDRIEEFRGDMEKAEAEADARQADYDTLMDRQASLAAFTGDESRLTDEAAAAVKSAADKYNQYMQQVYETRSAINSLRNDLSTVRSLRDRFEGYMYSVKGLMNAAKSDPYVEKRISGLIADIVRCPGEYETAIETAFGGAMQNIITETRDDARDLIEYLKSNRMGQVTFLPIEALRPRYENEDIRLAKREKGAVGFAIDLVTYDKKYENVIHNLLGNTLVCDNIASATVIAKHYPRAFKIVTLDGDVISSAGSMTGGSRRENSANLLANERRVKEIEDSIAQREKFMAKSDARMAELDAARKQAEQASDDLRKRLSDAAAELSGINERQSALLREISAKRADCISYEESVKEFERRLAEITDRYSDAGAGASILSEQSESANAEMDDMSGEYEALTEERDEKTEDLNNYNIEIAKIESSIKTSRDNIERLNGEKDGLAKKIASLEASIPDLAKEFESLTDQANKATLTEEELRVLSGIAKEIEDTENTKRDITDRISKLEEERLGGFNESNRLSAELNEKDRALQKIDDDLEHLRQRIEDEYGETYETCLAEKQEGYDIESSVANIAKYRRELTALGPVNVNAVEEYEAVSERYESMLKERDDLTKAIDDLTVALKEICDEMLTIFNDGFEKINENFRQTFRELFGGGTAELSIDYQEGQDPLEAGVEIRACPPGKKLEKLTLLSGGEQALTAIAILFAIIKMRPMPFCLLDEIEAALDDANVGRYANYLKKYSEDTQFIVITHRKPTMEVADTLFGVTMEERGVSKIVSVKLSEVETRLGGDTVQ